MTLTLIPPSRPAHPGPIAFPLTPGERALLAAIQAVGAQVTALTALVHALQTSDTTILKEVQMSASALQVLQAQVTQNTSIEQSAVQLIQGLAQEIQNAGTDPTALSALTSSLNTSAQALSAAITANTPAASTGTGTSTGTDTGTGTDPSSDTTTGASS